MRGCTRTPIVSLRKARRIPTTHLVYGFTLVEIIVVIAIFSILVSLGLFMSMETFRGSMYRSEEDIIVSVLQKARSRAMANIYQTPWGVCYIAPDYLLFRGTTCTELATNETIPAGSAVTITFSTPIVFSQLSATTTSGTVTVTQDGRTTTVTVNREGTINW